jgi:3-oxoadipate enol-lactonase
MPTLDVPGATLYYETDGRISDPALLLIHAGIATLRMWDPQAETLARDHFVIRYDTRGYGRTTCDDSAYSDRADALDLLDHLGVLLATVVGASRGGRIATDLALEHPDRVTGLVTVGAGIGGFDYPEPTEAEAALIHRIAAAEEAGEWELANSLDVELWCIAPNRHATELDPAFVETAFALNRDNLGHEHERPEPIPLSPSAWARLDELAVPTLVTVGDQDISEAVAVFAAVTGRLPAAEFHVFAGAAHLPNVERPHEFERLLTDWLARSGL